MEPEDLTVIGHAGDLLVDIYARNLTHIYILPQCSMTAARVLNPAGMDAQFERLRCAISRGILRTRIRTNNVIERLNREIRRRTRVVGTFPDGNSALMLVCARLRHVAGTQWGNKKYMNMKNLGAALDDVSGAG